MAGYSEWPSAINVCDCMFLFDIYILRKHEREKHLDTLKAAVRLIIYTLLLTPEGEVLRNESWGVDKLCYSIEQIFSHGFIGEHFWQIISQVCEEAVSLESQYSSFTAKGRAWIRHTLNKRLLGTCLHSLLNSELMNNFYDPHALLRSQDDVGPLCDLLKALDGIDFELNLKHLREFLEIPLGRIEDSYTSQQLPSPLPLPASSITFSPYNSTVRNVRNLQSALQPSTVSPSPPASTLEAPPVTEDFSVFQEWLNKSEREENSIPLYRTLEDTIENTNSITKDHKEDKKDKEDLEMKKLLADFASIPALDSNLDSDKPNVNSPTTNDTPQQELTPAPMAGEVATTQENLNTEETLQPPLQIAGGTIETGATATLQDLTQTMADELSKNSLPKITNKPKKKKVTKRKAVIENAPTKPLSANTTANTTANTPNTESNIIEPISGEEVTS